MDVIAKPLPLSRPLSDSLLSRNFAGGLYMPAGGGAPAIPSLLNAQKLSLSANWPVGSAGRVKVTDGFVVSGASGVQAGSNGFWFDNGLVNGKRSYALVRASTDFYTSWGVDGLNRWVIQTDNDRYHSNEDVTYPWLVITWVDDSNNQTADPQPTLTHPAVQELTAPSTAQGGVFVSGGSQDGIYKKNDTFGGKDDFHLLGLLSTPNDEVGEIVWASVDLGSGPVLAWWIFDQSTNALYYSLSDVATPDLAGSDKFVMAVSGVVYSKRGTFNGKSYYNKIGAGTSTSLDAIFWSSATWHITNAIGVDLDTSTSAVATPDLATFLLGTVVSNVAWLNASDDSPASIAVSSVSVGELNAGVLVAGAGTSAVNLAYQNDPTYIVAGFPGYTNGAPHHTLYRPATGWYVAGDDDYYAVDPSAVAFPWNAGTYVAVSGTPPAPTVTMDPVASEANWAVVP